MIFHREVPASCSSVSSEIAKTEAIVEPVSQSGRIECSWDGFSENTRPLSSLCLCQYPPEVSHCSRNRISVSSGKVLNSITNDVILSLKYDETTSGGIFIR